MPTQAKEVDSSDFSCSGQYLEKRASRCLSKVCTFHECSFVSSIGNCAWKMLAKVREAYARINAADGNYRPPRSCTLLATSGMNLNLSRFRKITSRMAQSVRLETSMGSMTLELYQEHAPRTVKNFVTLVSRNYYNGTIFHRVSLPHNPSLRHQLRCTLRCQVIPNFMVQGDQPKR